MRPGPAALPALLAALAAVALAHLSTGSSGCTPLDALGSPACARVVELRAVRLVAAASAGALLAASGALLQAATRNVLAEPFILGVSSGALAAVAAAHLALGPGAAYYASAPAALAGALAAFAATACVARAAGGTATALVLAGVGVTALLTGVAELELFILQSRYGFPYTLLLLGTAAYAGPDDAALLAAAAATAAPALLALSRRLDALVLGDDYAAQLGVDPARVRALASALAALYASLTVASLGVVGFVGLVAPNLARTLVGGAHARAAPAALLLGSLLTASADAAARLTSAALALGELPLGLYTGLIGGLFLAYLVASRLRRGLLP